MDNPKDLISGFTHSLDQGIAIELGPTAALIFNHIVYWLRFNARKKDENLREGKIWMYETQESIAESMGYFSLDDVKRGMKALLESGLLIKGNFNKNPFDKTNWYTTYDQELILNNKNSKKSYESAPARDRECARAPSDSAPVRDPSLYTENKDTLEEQQQQPPPAAVFSEEKQDKAKPSKVDHVYPPLAVSDIPHHDKVWLTKTYDEETVRHAIEFANHPKTVITTTLSQTLKWACKEKPDIPRDEAEIVEQNKKTATEIRQNSEIPSTCYMEVLNKNVELGHSTGQAIPFVLEYTEASFKEQLIGGLARYGIKPKDGQKWHRN